MADTTTDESVPVRFNVAGRPARPHAAGSSSSRVGSVAPGTEPALAPVLPIPKRRMIISHDKYVELQSPVILYLSEHEQKTGKRMDREELIDWYLEKKEGEMQDIEQLEYEKELITKLLRNLVKVGWLENLLLEMKGDARESMPSVDEDSQESSAAVEGENVRVYYMVHPSVDTESSMTLTSGY
ncbi:hypothetical protein BDZ97DRAFT_1687346 [Flammula alnicola]|nr:hypothetical protein BDZ97DRAFT_1687346 [Flammula alnicola]